MDFWQQVFQPLSAKRVSTNFYSVKMQHFAGTMENIFYIKTIFFDNMGTFMIFLFV